MAAARAGLISIDWAKTPELASMVSNAQKDTDFIKPFFINQTLQMKSESRKIRPLIRMSYIDS